MYLRIVNNTTTYPYTIKNLRDSLPNVSLPASLSNEQLVEWDMYEVQFSAAPNDYTKNIIEDNICKYVKLSTGPRNFLSYFFRAS